MSTGGSSDSSSSISIGSDLMLSSACSFTECSGSFPRLLYSLSSISSSITTDAITDEFLLFYVSYSILSSFYSGGREVSSSKTIFSIFDLTKVLLKAPMGSAKRWR